MLSANGLAHPPPETVVSGSSCSSSSLQHKQRLSSSAWFQNFLNFFKHRTELNYGVTLRNCANTMKITKFKLHQLYSQTEQAIGHTSLAGEHLLPFQCFNFIYTQTNYAKTSSLSFLYKIRPTSTVLSEDIYITEEFQYLHYHSHPHTTL